MATRHEMIFEGVPVAYWEGGRGFPLLLIHGSGPGASTAGNWRLVLPMLEQHFHVIAIDLIGFGQSGRKPAPPYFDLGLWHRQANHALGLFGSEQVGVLGHSLSGSISLRLAALDRRVSHVMTTGTMGTVFPLNEHLVRTWSFPPTRDAIRLAARSLIFDESVITDPYIDGRVEVLHQGDYGDYFASMFEGDKQRYIDAAALDGRLLRDIVARVCMVHGRNDLPIPWQAASCRLAEFMPQADVMLLARCGHSPALEHPEKLVALARDFFR
ncbi:alpha/beta hydrolase [Bradyrhizobium sp. NP1]|uniref:alpha/beta fold hydrolase n=1 Tax=Bradyrhizobium sp. NP1 TaxID=3049772 RepID=UPI0025A5F0D9|nr:alpha/beta hydrolase [Bradyrhizobium sp. NP1]WJR75745.1 alpha/beta hydrolase [Bradyrhizobium sp. NP1]